MIQSKEYQSTVSWADLVSSDYDGLILPGGHAPGMRQYLGSAVLGQTVNDFWSLGRPIGAICHGVLVLARTVNPATGRSVIFHRHTTWLPKYLERGAYLATAWRLGHHCRTFLAYVEDEVRNALDDPAQLERGPRVLGARRTSTDDRPTFVVEDGTYVSARWPGDAYLFSRRFLERLG